MTIHTPDIYKLLKTAAQQKENTNVDKLDMEKIAAHMKEAFDPKRFIIRERFKFWSNMNRQTGESTQELATRIRQEATTCDFSTVNDPLDEAVTTKFMCSVNNEALLKLLLSMKSSEITFNRAVEIAMEVEEATKAAKETANGPQQETEKATINKIKSWGNGDE